MIKFMVFMKNPIKNIQGDNATIFFFIIWDICPAKYIYQHTKIGIFIPIVK